MSNHDLGDNFANLSDAEIQVLHEIVQLANEKPGPAFGPSLFAAYDEVIARDQTTTAQSSKYFTFICRMLWGRKQHETVTERFVGLLAEAGIAVEPYTDDEGGTEYTQPQDDGVGHEQELHSFERRRLESRDGRNGVLSSAETLAGEEDAPRSLQKGSLAPTADTQDTSTRPFKRRTQRSRSEDTHMRGIPGLDRGRLIGRVSSAQYPHRRPRRTGSVSSTRSLRIQRSHSSAYGAGDAYSADESDSLEATQQSRRHSISAAVPLPLPTTSQMPQPFSSTYLNPRPFLSAELFQRSEEHLDAIAETFLETKDRVVQRRIMMKWVHKANQAQATHEQLQLLAANFDRAKLTRNTWVIWRERLDNIRLDRDWKAKEGVYTAMEQTAARERGLNLKWVALSHWRAVAEDEKQRTSVARRHIMRKRYFQAWSNITALNELKIRRFVLSRFFAKWQERLQQAQAQNEQALATRDIELLRRIYWKWFYTFGNKVAPNMHNRHIERQFFSAWRDRLQQVWEQEQQAEEHFFVGVESGRFVSWRAKAQELLQMKRTAEEFQKRKLLGRVLDTWRREVILAPRATQLTQRLDARLQNTVLQTWHARALQSRQAFQTDQQRILRNAFTAWNDRLRINFLQGQIELRLKSETIYKWRIAARRSAAGRTYDRKLASTTLQHWLHKAQNRHRSIEGAEATFAASQRRRTLRRGIRGLGATLEHQRQLEDEAVNFRQTRLLYGAFAKWRQRSADVDLLDRKAKAAEFYFLTTKTLKRWSHSTEEHRKYRKREAYSQIRRLCKMNLAREMLRRMQIQLAHVRNLDHHSLEFQEDHVVSSTVTTFRNWKQRAATLLEQERQAEAHYNRKLTVAVLQKMVQRKNQLQDMAAQARELSAGSAGVEAMNCLRKLDRRLFQIKGQEQWAVALRDKHWERHVKNMLRYWLEQASAARRQRAGRPIEEDVFRTSAMTAPAIDDLTVFDHTAWNLDPLDLHLDEFAHTAHGEVDATFIDNDGIITSTPMPGYLRTPSKRNTARAKARERLVASNAPITTGRTLRFADQVPATAPPRQQTLSAPPVLPSPSGPSITPFERKLREQGYTSPSVHGRRTPARGGGFGTSRFGASVGSGRFGVNTPARSTFAGFEDIPEVSEDRSRGF